MKQKESLNSSSLSNHTTDKNSAENKGEKQPKLLEDIFAALRQNPEVAGLMSSIGAILLGGILLLDDYKDFGKDGSERDPAMPHHWLWGALTLIGGVAGACTSGLALLKKMPIPQKPLQRAPESFLKQAVPLDELQKKLLDREP